MVMLDLIDEYREFPPKTMDFILFLSAQGTFSRRDHILGHKSSLGKFQKIEIISSTFSDQNAVRLGTNYSRDITLPTKVHLIKAMVSPGVRYGCESWMVKKAEHRRIDAFELWCWRRLVRVPWTARRSNQSILKEISPG